MKFGVLVAANSVSDYLNFGLCNSFSFGVVSVQLSPKLQMYTYGKGHQAMMFLHRSSLEGAMKMICALCSTRGALSDVNLCCQSQNFLFRPENHGL